MYNSHRAFFDMPLTPYCIHCNSSGKNFKLLTLILYYIILHKLLRRYICTGQGRFSTNNFYHQIEVLNFIKINISIKCRRNF